MKPIVLLISLFTFYVADAATYYLSTSTGSDNRTAAQAQNQGTPWKTLIKINTVALNPGDSVLLKRGETFTGGLVVNHSGSASNQIVFDAYGSGEKPIITGFTSVSNWKFSRNNIYEFSNPAYPENINMVVVDGELQPIGRYPKATASNGGFLTNQTHVGYTSLTSSAIAGLPSFTGGEIVMKKYQWILDRGRIIGQSGSTVTIDHFIAPNHPTAYYDIIDNHGFFFQNHVNALSLPNEWCYESATKKIKMFLPGNANVEVSTIENLVTISSKSFLRFNNLAFTGANSNAILITNASDNISITNCDFNFSGIDAIHANASALGRVTVEGCSITNTNNNAIEAGSTRNWLITNNTIINTGMIAGMGLTGDGQYNAISYTSDGSIIQNNKIKNTGYLGIHFSGNNTLIKNNFVENFVMIKSDGGGIYTYGETDKVNRIVTGNIVINGPGNLFGTNEDSTNPYAGQVHGIYMDGGSANVSITKNTVANSSHAGIWLSSPKGVVVANNTLYDNTVAQLKVSENTDQISNLSVRQNLLFATDSAELISSYFLKFSTLSSIGLVDSNYYARPLYEPTGISTYGYPNVPTYHNYPGGGIIEGTDNKFYSLDQWQTLANQDAHSRKTHISINNLNKIKFEFNASGNAKTIQLDGIYTDLNNISYNNTIELQPFTSIILIRTGAALTNQYITFEPISNKTVNDSAFQVNATASSNLPVRFKIISGPASLNGNTITTTGLGIVKIEASQPGNNIYNIATPVIQTFAVLPDKKCKIKFLNNAQISLAPTCGNSDGNITIEPTSGVAPFVYSINGGVSYVSGGSNGYTFSNLPAGTYYMKLKDANNCESEVVEKVLASTNCPTVCTPPTFINNGTIVLDASCGKKDGNISIIPLNGNAPFQYSLDGGATYVTGGNAGYTFDQLAAGSYHLRLKDGRGCESVIVEKNVRSQNCTTTCTKPTFLNNDRIMLDASCSNNDGNISFIPLSGVAPFTYSLDNGKTYVPGPEAGYGFMNLSAGTYWLRMKDSNGCESDVVEKTLRIIYGAPCIAPIVLSGKNSGQFNLPGSNKSAGLQTQTIAAFPNPSKGQFKVAFDNFKSSKLDITISDAKGTILLRETISISRKATAFFDLTGKPAGMYYVKVVGEKEMNISQLVIQ